MPIKTKEYMTRMLKDVKEKGNRKRKNNLYYNHRGRKGSSKKNYDEEKGAGKFLTTLSVCWTNKPY